MKIPCRICQNTTGNATYLVKEMEFGSREEFQYLECRQCGCVQLITIPENMGKYYPADYFAFRSYNHLVKNELRRFFDKRRVISFFTGKGIIGKIASRFGKPLDYLEWVGEANLDTDARILDVGCGEGQLLLRMHIGGFHNVIGVDPFIVEDKVYPHGVTVYKQDIRDLAAAGQKKFDLIMFHHSFEHMDEPDGVLAAAKALLSSSGTILIVLPVADSYVWKHYREHWRGLRAPRHFFLHTGESMKILTNRQQLAIYKVTNNSHPAQFMESELYKKGIPSNAPREKKDIFSKKQQDDYRIMTELLDKKQEGESATYYLRHRSS